MLEVIVTTEDEYTQAIAGGASRVELVSAMEADGLTPLPEVLNAICEKHIIPIRVMVRFHNNGFIYTKNEIQQMSEWITHYSHLPIDGFVIGGLTSENSIDTYLLEEIAKHCGAKKLTFHRAFDNLNHTQQLHAIEILKNYPIDTVLTSGGRIQSLEKNLEHLSELSLKADKITILIGGGINLSTMKKIQKYPHLQSIHIGSAAHYHNDFSYAINPENISVFKNLLECKSSCYREK
ncbi:MAG: copper homeostasis protein CutC [Treponemataceae bacterium]